MCLYVGNYDDVGVYLGGGSRRARKQHRCVECRRTIEPGETYEYWSWAMDGTVDTAKMCAHCQAVLTIGHAITGCPKVWNVTMMFDRDPEIGFVANCLHDDGHALTHVERSFLEALQVEAERKWRPPDRDELLPVPTWEGADG